MDARDPDGVAAMLAELAAGQVVVRDGAMGTMLHAAGVPLDRSLPELNLSRPGLVRDIHAAYVTAGARFLQTNTFGANRLRLAADGLEGSVSEINIAGARLAREAAQRAGQLVLVAGSVGPAASAPSVRRVPATARADTLREQIAALCDWVDLLVLGANCTVGPAVLVDVVRELARATDLPVSVQPNAGVPHRLGSQVRYARNAAYFAEAAPRFIGSGATLLGGFCGTTPAHVRAIAHAVSALPPARRAPTPRAQQAGTWTGSARVVPPAPEAASGWPWETELVVAVGLQAPRGPEVPEFVERAGMLHAAGAGVLAVTEPPPPAARVNPVGIAVVLRERVGCEVLLPVEAADRNLAALQADLLGAHALGLRMVVCRTGSPRVAGDYPSAASPWDIDSVGLVGMLGALNEGVDWRGVATSEHTRSVIGATFHTAARDLGREVERAEAKCRAGAHFLVTDVIYDVEDAARVLARPSRSRLLPWRSCGTWFPVSLCTCLRTWTSRSGSW